MKTKPKPDQLTPDPANPNRMDDDTKAGLARAVLRALIRLSLKDDRRRARSEADKARKTIVDIQARQERLLEALLSGTIDQPTYKAKAGQLADRKALAWESASCADTEEIDIDAALDLCETFLARLGDLWLQATPDAQNDIMRAFVGQAMVLHPDKAVTTTGNGGIHGILEAFPTSPAKWHPTPVWSYNQVAGIISALMPVRKLLEVA